MEKLSSNNRKLRTLSANGWREFNENGTLTVRYKAPFGKYFEIDGDATKLFEVSGNLEYVRYCLRDKLRKFENGQIKMFKGSSTDKKKERDWEYEEIIKERLWSDVNGCETPSGYRLPETVCTARVEHSYC